MPDRRTDIVLAIHTFGDDLTYWEPITFNPQPGGSWQDMLGQPLLPAGCVDTEVCDPCFFKEDNGDVYTVSQKSMREKDNHPALLLRFTSYGGHVGHPYLRKEGSLRCKDF